jgi:hypothetical protein
MAALIDHMSLRKTVAEVGVRFLDPGTTKIFTAAHDLLHVQIEDPDWEGDRLYRGVFAVMAFPISCPDKFISLRFFEENSRDKEIGMIEDPTLFPSEVQDLIHRSLARNYFEQIISRVRSVEFTYGLLFFDVETGHGRREFQMRWRYDRTQDFGENGKVLLDVYENRFIIPDISSLPKADREALTRYIYW